MQYNRCVRYMQQTRNAPHRQKWHGVVTVVSGEDNHPEVFHNNSAYQVLKRSYTFLEAIVAINHQFLECCKRENQKGSVLQMSLICGTMVSTGACKEHFCKVSHFMCLFLGLRHLPPQWHCSGLCQLSTEPLVKP